MSEVGECRDWVVIAIFIGFFIVVLIVALQESKGE